MHGELPTLIDRQVDGPRGRCPARKLLQIRSDREALDPERFDPSFKIWSDAQSGLVAERLHLECERQDRLNIATGSDGGHQNFHGDCSPGSTEETRWPDLAA